ncbi:MAG: F-type H+-transporting ATPase subunit delta [Myxococcota bacterium]|jgi:F-type H+-transporting ATPase subunit delta
MAEGALSRRYARALIGIGQELDQVDAFADDLSTFTAALSLDDGLLSLVLSNPGLTSTERRDVLQAVLARLQLSRTVDNFLNLLLDKSRLLLFEKIQAAYQEMADELAGRVRATVTTAAPMQPAEAAQISGVLSTAMSCTVTVDYQVDPELIGGIVARVGDTVFDASIRTRLQDMRERLSR